MLGGARWHGPVAYGTIAASIGILALATARGGVLGAVLGALYLLFSGGRSRGRLVAMFAAVAVLVAASLWSPVADLWTERLQSGVAGFDRTATWISGLRMGKEDPLSGLGSVGVEEAVTTDLDFRSTPAGSTSVVPHNIFLLGLAEGGILTLAALVAFAAAFVAAIRHRPRRGSPCDRLLVAGLIATGAVSLINNLFTHPEVAVPAMLVLTIVASGTPAARERERAGDLGDHGA